eukprot:4076901-Pyramimonas_sp.AAC.1
MVGEDGWGRARAAQDRAEAAEAAVARMRRETERSANDVASTTRHYERWMEIHSMPKPPLRDSTGAVAWPRTAAEAEAQEREAAAWLRRRAAGLALPARSPPPRRG